MKDGLFQRLSLQDLADIIASGGLTPKAARTIIDNRLNALQKKPGRPPKILHTGEFVRTRPAPYDVAAEVEKLDNKKSRFSAATRKKMAKAQKKRWATRKKVPKTRDSHHK